MDELCFVADCVVVYLQEGGSQPFQSPDIWHTQYAIDNVQKLFSKPDPTDKTTIDEYNKFFRQPLKMLVAAGVLREEGKKNNTIQFSVENEAVLDYLSLRERNCFDFLCSYITKTLKDSGLWDAFESFFDEQTAAQYNNVKEKFRHFCWEYTPIKNSAEPNRIFTKVLNPLSVLYKKKGTVGGYLSKKIITLADIKYNRTNFETKTKKRTFHVDRLKSQIWFKMIFTTTMWKKQSAGCASLTRNIMVVVQRLLMPCQLVNKRHTCTIFSQNMNFQQSLIMLRI
jgi:hypothetical protein